MFTFASFPVALDDSEAKYAIARHFEDFVDDDEDMDVDVDDEDFASGRKLTCPGEPITSASAFMRYVICITSPHSVHAILSLGVMERMWRMTRSSHRSPARSTG